MPIALVASMGRKSYEEERRLCAFKFPSSLIIRKDKIKKYLDEQKECNCVMEFYLRESVKWFVSTIR